MAPKEMGGVMSFLFWLQFAPLATLAGISALAVFGSVFRDNLVQRVGLSLVSIGSCLQVVEAYHRTGTQAPMMMIVYGASVYAIGTFLKIAHQHHKGQRNAEKH